MKTELRPNTFLGVKCLLNHSGIKLNLDCKGILTNAWGLGGLYENENESKNNI